MTRKKLSGLLFTAAIGALMVTGACTEQRAKPSDFDPKSTVETTKPAGEEAREPDSIQFREMGPAPELAKVQFFANTKPMFMQDMRGKLVLLTFFDVADSVASRKFIRRYNDMNTALHGRGVQVMGVLTGSGLKTMQQLQQKVSLMQMGFPVVLDADGSAAQDYKAASLPAMYLIDQEGKIIFSRAGAGGTDYTENAVRQKLGMPLIPERD